MINIGTVIKKLRKAQGLTQTELASKLNATQKIITSYEHGRRIPTPEKLIKLADIFNVSLDELVGRKKIIIQQKKDHLHKNSRTAKIQDFFNKLSEDEQRITFKQVKALVESKEH